MREKEERNCNLFHAREKEVLFTFEFHFFLLRVVVVGFF